MKMIKLHAVKNGVRWVVLGAAVLGMAGAERTLADVYYQVGPGQAYATIAAAIAATPFVVIGVVPNKYQPFTESHIINIHAGTYVGTDTDPASLLNAVGGTNCYSRTSKTCRLIIQAEPGDRVIVTNALNDAVITVRESHVTIRGLTFAGATNSPNAYYTTLNATNRGGIIVQNCEFVGGRGLKGPITPMSEEPGVDFSAVFINNYIHDFETHYEVPPPSNLKQMHSGNLYVEWGNQGGGSIFGPYTTATSPERWYLNNTIYKSVTNVNFMVLRHCSSDVTNNTSVFYANNITIRAGTAGGHGYYLSAPTTYAVMANNIQFGLQKWGYNLADYATLDLWNARLAELGKPLEVNSQWTDPLFNDAANRDFRIKFGISPAFRAADTSYWNTAISSLGIANLITGYWNPVTDPGLQHVGTPVHVGATIEIRPTGTVFTGR